MTILAVVAIVICGGGVPEEAQALIDAYPDHVKGWDSAGLIVFSDGTTLRFGEPRESLNFEARFQSATLWDQMSLPYSPGWRFPVPRAGEDPGRLRCEAFFSHVYGSMPQEVEKNLVKVPWPGARAKRTITFSRVNGAAKALELVGIALSNAPKEVRRYVARPQGTYAWRTIAGSDQRSMHSFGIAIDFAMPNIPRTYWRWQDGEYPQSILQDDNLRQVVEVFERYGFIWGGKWHHYDLMHFEFRPELLKKRQDTRKE